MVDTYFPPTTLTPEKNHKHKVLKVIVIFLSI